VVKFKGKLTATPRGGGGTLVPVPRDVASKLELDTAPRTVEPPPDLARAMARDKKMAASWETLSFTNNWETLSFTNKKEMALGLEEAKKPETRERRLKAAIAKLRA
jgi:uncharacterized protein YdeI (YjbR/CyaY-like superfamily)